MEDGSPPLPPRGLSLRTVLEAAGVASLRYFGVYADTREKADGSLVTAADFAAEAVLLDAIQRGWPGETIHSEERGTIPGRPDAYWMVDPLDGTSAFTEGLAHWGPTVARIVRGADRREALDMGAILLPRLGEHYHVEGGRGWFNGALLPPLATRALPRVIYLPSGFHRHYNVAFAGKARCLGGTAAHLALVARGSARAVIVAPGWSIWDTAAGLGLIEAVGGRALRLSDAAPLDPLRDVGSAFIAGEALVVDELVSPGRVAPIFQGAGHG